MFWKKSPRLPITREDQIWVEESLSFLGEALGEDKLLAIENVTPSKRFFDRNFDGSERDARFILQTCMELMHVKKDRIVLEFYSEGNRVLDDGTIITTTADIFGSSSGASGTYQKQKDKAIIRIEKGQLKHPESLIATIAHELAHEKLLGENRIIENDEYLTDLTAIAYGFGIFIANAKFQFSNGINGGFGWQMASQGYLPEQVSAYAMASLALKKGETSYPYKSHLNASVRKYFERSLDYLKWNHASEDTTVFWSISVHHVEKEEEQSSNSKKAQDTSESPKTLKQWRQEIMHACYSGATETIEGLLQEGRSPNFNTIGGSPLTIAVKATNKNMVECLLRYGADLNFSEPDDIMDKLPLMAACENLNIAMVHWLIQMGAEVDRVAGNGKSVLEVAAETGSIELVEVLLKSGAHTEIKSGHYMSFDKTPLTAAVTANNTTMFSYLVKNGAKTKPIRKMKRSDIHPKMVKFLKAKKYL